MEGEDVSRILPEIFLDEEDVSLDDEGGDDQVPPQIMRGDDEIPSDKQERDDLIPP